MASEGFHSILSTFFYCCVSDVQKTGKPSFHRSWHDVLSGTATRLVTKNNIIFVKYKYFSVFLSAKLKNMRLKVQENSDERLQRMQETLSAIKIIKMYTWEQFFHNRISESRR